MTGKLNGSAIFMRLGNHKRAAKPRLVSALQLTCHTIEAVESRVAEMTAVADAFCGKGISDCDLASYAVLFRDSETAAEKREQMIERIRQFGFGPCKAGKMADAIVTSASMAGVVPDISNLDILFTMVVAALDSNVPGRAVCEAIQANDGNLALRCFAVSCLERARSRGNEPDIREDDLVSLLSFAVAAIQKA
ncbi:MAG: hypothetical protein ABII71_03910 [Candidatus Micrarchaeota archaeon]